MGYNKSVDRQQSDAIGTYDAVLRRWHIGDYALYYAVRRETAE